MAKKNRSQEQQRKFEKISKSSMKQLGILNEAAKSENTIPNVLILDHNAPGFFFGATESAEDSYIGIPKGTEGNILVIGGNGSGKSAGIAKPTTLRFNGSLIATDIKGELSDYYRELYVQGKVRRPYITWNPLNPNTLSYDPFAWLSEDAPENLINNIREIALAIIPNRPHDHQPFWADTERGVLEAALLYFYQLGLSFSETMCKIAAYTTTDLCDELSKSKDIRIKMILGEVTSMKPETLACFDRGLRNSIKLFATDSFISHALRGKREDASCFSWKDLEKNNVFLRIPENLIEQWKGAISLLLTQLIRYLERRADKYSAEGKSNDQILILLDEFPRFGKLEMIASAMSTLRSKNTNICLMVQSLAQLDRIYGAETRRIICDNCQYKIILRANDAETQNYISKLCGSYIHSSNSVSRQLELDMKCKGYGIQSCEMRDAIIQPEELATLKDVLLLTPDGFCRVKKLLPGQELVQKIRFFDGSELNRKNVPTLNYSDMIKANDEGAKVLTIKDRLANADRKIDGAIKKLELAERQAEEDAAEQRLAEKIAQETEKKRNQRRCYVVGEMVINAFPELMTIVPGTRRENDERFKKLKAMLDAVADDPRLLKEIKEKGMIWMVVEEYRCSLHKK